MLRKLTLCNFKPFERYTITFKRLNVLVGRNNAGKSSILQALRLVDTVLKLYHRDKIELLPAPVNGELQYAARIEGSRIPFSLANVHYNLEDDVTTVSAELHGGFEVHVFFVPGRPHEAYGVVTRAGEAIDHRLLKVKSRPKVSLGFLPPVGPFEETEQRLSADHVRRSMGTQLAPRHFCNLWHHFPDKFGDFQRLLSDTWPGITIEGAPEYSFDDNALYMFFKEDRIDREISWAGHGLQIWFQILTHLVKNQSATTMILDEPDVYLHPDLQRRTMDVVRKLGAQVIIATHSVEIVNEVEPEEITVIDAATADAQPLSDLRAVQQTVNELGSTQNIQLSRLAQSRSVLYVEGDDFKILSKIAMKLGKVEFSRRRDLTPLSMEGFTNWRNIEAVGWAFRNIFDEQITAFVLLDRDYSTDEEIRQLSETLTRHGVRCHVWERKEIENYLLVQDVIERAVAERLRGRRESVDSALIHSSVSTALVEATDSIKHETFSQALSSELASPEHARKDTSTRIMDFTSTFDDAWQDLEWRTSKVSGKSLVSRLNQRFQKELKVSISIPQLIRLMEPDEVPREMQIVITEIDRFAR